MAERRSQAGRKRATLLGELEHEDSQAAARFLALVQTELSAQAARILARGVAPPDATNAVSFRFEDGRTVLAIFAEPPQNPAEIGERLALLATAFDESPRAIELHKSRYSVARSLKDELLALCQRAMALDALVIDADSPVVWGSANSHAFRPSRPDYSTALLVEGESAHDWSEPELATAPSEPPPAETPEEEDSAVTSSSPLAEDTVQCVERALAHVRELDALDALAKGKPLVHHYVSDEFGVAAHSFSSIYLVLLVYPGRFDELRAERATAEALPRIEELVSALPPLDPEPAPMAGVVRIGRRRR